MQISNEDISVVVQGPIVGNGVTKQCLLDVRHSLPGAEIILSSWADTAPADLECDVYVANQDPGGIWFLEGKGTRSLNVTRQIACTLAGIKAARRKYVLKLRSDLRLTGDGFKAYFGRFDDVGESRDRFVTHRILTSNIFTGSSLRCQPKYSLLYHVSDFVHFGTKEDLLLVWDIDESAYTVQGGLNEVEREDVRKSKAVVERDLYTRLIAEQCITLSFYKKFQEIDIFSRYTGSLSEYQRSLRLLVNNFVVLDSDQWTFFWCRPFEWLDVFSWIGVMSHREWLAHYRREFGQRSWDFSWVAGLKQILWWMTCRRMRRLVYLLLFPFRRRIVNWKV